MDLRSLRYFVETVKLRSFTAAAKSLGVTQSTISKMIRQLEDSLGEPLLIRDHRQFQLTDCGRVVMEQAQDILQRVQRLHTELHEVQALQRGRLDIGIPPMINMLFTEVLQQFTSTYPHIELNLHEDTGMGIEALVSNGGLEMGMSILPINPDPAITCSPVARHEVWAMGHKSCFKHLRPHITLAELAASPLIFLNDDFALTRSLRLAFAQAGLQINIHAQSGHWDWVAAMAQAGMGIALLPEPFVSRAATPDTHITRIKDPELYWDVALLWNGRYLSLAARAWLEICQQRLGKQWLDLNLPDNN